MNDGTLTSEEFLRARLAEEGRDYDEEATHWIMYPEVQPPELGEIVFLSEARPAK